MLIDELSKVTVEPLINPVPPMSVAKLLENVELEIEADSDFLEIDGSSINGLVRGESYAAHY